MKVLKLLATLTFAAFAAACAPLGGGTSAPITSSSQSATAPLAHMVCERTEQKGCIEFDILNLKYNPKSVLQKGLDQPATSEAERRRRALELGPELYKAYKAGREQPSQPRDFLIYMWNVAPSVPLSHMKAYQLDGFTLSTVPFSEMTGVSPVPTFDPISGLGKPDRVFRIRADGKKPIGAAFQVPWSTIGPQTYILVCTEDDLAVYPNRITAKEGLWLTPEYLMAVKARGWDYILMPFISKDRPSVVRPPAKPTPKKKAESDLTVAMAPEGDREE